MRKFNAIHKYRGASTIVELTTFNDYLDWLKEQSHYLENGDEGVVALQEQITEVANLYINYGNNTVVYAVDNHADPITFEIFKDFKEV